ncbi:MULTISPECIES: ArsR/SmtB family transcription factor [Isoptericola]|nr:MULTISPECIES: metalloregulator ArsR/SmtB family transcription factor [Isoptericola]
MTTALPLASPTCCTPARAAVDTEEAQRVARVFKALGDPTRVLLLSTVTAAAEGEACVCDLTEPVGLSQPTVSHHLKILVDAGLLSRTQRGRWSYYAPVPGALDRLADTLRELA